MTDLAPITKVELIEWYDGFVSGIVQNVDGVYLFYLLAFAADLRARKFAVVALAPDEFSALESATRTQESAEIQSSLASVSIGRAQMWWTDAEPAVGERVALREFTPSELLELDPPIFPSIERVTSDAAIARWLES